MRYYCYNELGDDDQELIIVKSEDDIRKEYWPYWYERMCKKFGQKNVDKKFSFQDCLDDWVIVNWAWESKDRYDDDNTKN